MTPTPTPGGLRWTSLIGLGLRLKLAARRAKLADTTHWQQQSARLQAGVLRDNLAKAAGTEIGREHGFAKLASITRDDQLWDAYRAAVPLGDWYSIKDRVARMREQGEPDVLWPGLVGHFAQTSGTTAGDKFIPVSREMFKSNYNASLDIFAHLMNREVSPERLMGGRCLFLGGSSDLKANEHGVITGDLSGLVTPLIRWPLSAIYSPGPKIALLDDWPAKIEAMADLTLRQDIRFISGMPSWAHALMTRVVGLARERGSDAESILDIWPHLTVFVHGGVRYEPFRRRLGEVVTGSPEGDFAHRHELYPASEGFVAMQDEPNPGGAQAGLRLNVDLGNAFEFVPTELVRDDGSLADDAVSHHAGQVETGVRYCVVISSCAGLWRYNIGDVVEFDSVPDGLEHGDARAGTGPARLRIVGRHRHFINAFGENLIVEHIETAVAAAAAETGLETGEFTAAPVYPAHGTPAGLELVIELPADLPRDRLAALGSAFDVSLKAQNVDYATKRGEDLGMAPPTLTPVPPGAFHRWMAGRGKLGGQHKCPRCANHRDFVEGVAVSAGVRAELPETAQTR
ncbi:MAG: GH3 auxin-responsive promoter family protein [Planctomycetota bacterium]